MAAQRGEDMAQLYSPIPTGVSGVQSLCKAASGATAEVKKLLFDECDVIIECKFCRAMFRSLPNFISHKRTYCRGLTSYLETAQAAAMKELEKQIQETVTAAGDGQRDKDTSSNKEKEKDDAGKSIVSPRIAKPREVAKSLQFLKKRQSERLKRVNIVSAVNKKVATVDVLPEGATEKIPLHVVPTIYRETPKTTMENGIQKLVTTPPTSTRNLLPEEKTAFLLPQALSKYGEMALRVRKEQKLDTPVDLSPLETEIIARLDKGDCLIFLNINTLKCNNIDCVGHIKRFDSLKSLALHCGRKHTKPLPPDDNFYCFLCDKSFEGLEEIGEHYEMEHWEEGSTENITPPKERIEKEKLGKEKPMKVEKRNSVEMKEASKEMKKEQSPSNDPKTEHGQAEETTPTDGSTIRPSRQRRRPDWLEEYEVQTVDKKRKRGERRDREIAEDRAETTPSPAGSDIFRAASQDTAKKKRRNRNDIWRAFGATRSKLATDSNRGATEKAPVRDSSPASEIDGAALSQIQSAQDKRRARGGEAQKGEESTKDDGDCRETDGQKKPSLKFRYSKQGNSANQTVIVKEKKQEKIETCSNSASSESNHASVDEVATSAAASSSSLVPSTPLSQQVVLPPPHTTSIKLLDQIIEKHGFPFKMQHMTPKARRDFVRKHTSWTPSEADIILDAADETVTKQDTIEKDNEMNDVESKHVDIAKIPVFLSQDQKQTFFGTIQATETSEGKRCYYCFEKIADYKNSQDIRRHLVGHFRAVRLKCKLCQAGSFFGQDMRKHLMERGCDQLHKLPSGFKLKDGMPCMTVQQADDLTEIVDHNHPGRVMFTSGAIVSIHSIKPYFPNPEIEEKILGVGKIVGMTGNTVARRIPIAGAGPSARRSLSVLPKLRINVGQAPNQEQTRSQQVKSSDATVSQVTTTPPPSPRTPPLSSTQTLAQGQQLKAKQLISTVVTTSSGFVLRIGPSAQSSITSPTSGASTTSVTSDTSSSSGSQQVNAIGTSTDHSGLHVENLNNGTEINVTD